MSDVRGYFLPYASLRSIIASRIPPQLIDALANPLWLKPTRNHQSRMPRMEETLKKYEVHFKRHLKILIDSS
jgi:hypothetical protein